MAVQIVFETHATTRDNEAGIATGWLPGELSDEGINRWALEHLLLGRRLEDLVDAPFSWRTGWEFRVPSGWYDGSEDKPAS